MDFKISVVVCTYNRSDILKHCLDSLVDQKVESSSFEVIVVDNNSSDNTKDVVQEYCEKHSNFRYVFEIEQGLSCARNSGWKESKAKWIAYLDDDAKVESDWCETVLNLISNNKSVAAFGGIILPWYIKAKPNWFKDRFEIRSYGDEVIKLNMKQHPFGLNGSNMIFRKDILRKYNGFSREFGMKGNGVGLGEESKLFYTMIKNIEDVRYFPKLKVYHLVGEKSYSFKYRWQRSIKAGESISRIRDAEIFSFDLCKKFLMLTYLFCCFVPTFIIGVFFKAILFEKIGRLGYFYGYVKSSLLRI